MVRGWSAIVAGSHRRKAALEKRPRRGMADVGRSCDCGRGNDEGWQQRWRQLAWGRWGRTATTDGRRLRCIDVWGNCYGRGDGDMVAGDSSRDERNRVGQPRLGHLQEGGRLRPRPPSQGVADCSQPIRAIAAHGHSRLQHDAHRDDWL
ncbi:hypothetical protein B296_00048158 [Ensete ventricosum]|uniref:Uncharacterized protein n=1 Tax=Ensete ventricosum TaxID=4639 RepID=A0A426X9U6_ENSVE|nr:hypothetical protein B296_00048158 [Ensete ventricosum]